MGWLVSFELTNVYKNSTKFYLVYYNQLVSYILKYFKYICVCVSDFSRIDLITSMMYFWYVLIVRKIFIITPSKNFRRKQLSSFLDYGAFIKSKLSPVLLLCITRVQMILNYFPSIYHYCVHICGSLDFGMSLQCKNLSFIRN